MLMSSLACLKEVFCLLRNDPSCICAEALFELAALCQPGRGSGVNEIRRVLIRRTANPGQYPMPPSWMKPETPFPEDCLSYGTDEECGLLRLILLIASQLRRKNELSALAALADAAHNCPEAIIQRDDAWMLRIHRELMDFGRDYALTLPAGEDKPLDTQEE